MLKTYTELDQQAESEGRAIATLQKIRPKRPRTKCRQHNAEKPNYPCFSRGVNYVREWAKKERAKMQAVRQRQRQRIEVCL